MLLTSKIVSSQKLTKPYSLDFWVFISTSLRKSRRDACGMHSTHVRNCLEYQHNNISITNRTYSFPSHLPWFEALTTGMHVKAWQGSRHAPPACSSPWSPHNQCSAQNVFIMERKFEGKCIQQERNNNILQNLFNSRQVSCSFSSRWSPGRTSDNCLISVHKWNPVIRKRMETIAHACICTAIASIFSRRPRKLYKANNHSQSKDSEDK